MKRIILSLLLATSAAAAKTETMQTLMPLEGQSELTPVMSAIDINYNFDSATSSAKGSGTQAQLKYYYGLADNLALGMELEFMSLKIDSSYFNGTSVVETSSTSSGISDIVLKYKGNYDLSVVNLYWGLGGAFAPEVSKDKSLANGDFETNATTGQNAYLVSAAVVAPVSSIKLGASVDYKDRLEGKVERESSSGVVTKYNRVGGASLDTRAFIEFDQYAHLNVAVADLRKWDSLSKNEAGTSVITSSGYDLLGIEVSARFNLATNFEVIPQLNYYQFQNISGTGIENAGYVFLGTSARWIF